MKIISDKDRYIATTWGAAVRLEAGVPKVVGDKIIIPKGQYKIQQVIEYSDDLPGDTGTVPDPMVTDLGMDITDFLKQLTPEQRRFYTQLSNEGKFTVKCRR